MHLSSLLLHLLDVKHHSLLKVYSKPQKLEEKGSRKIMSNIVFWVIHVQRLILLDHILYPSTYALIKHKQLGCQIIMSRPDFEEVERGFKLGVIPSPLRYDCPT